MPETRPVAAPRMRRRGFWALGVAVVLAHLLLSNRLLENRLGWGAGEAPPPRIEVAFVRELAAAAPPTLVSVAPAPAERHLAAVAPVAVVPPGAASAPPGPASAPDDDGPGVPSKVSESDGAALPLQPDPPLVPPPPPVPAVPAPAVLAPAVLADARPASAPADPAAAMGQAAIAQAAVAASRAAAAASAVAFEWPPSTRLSFKLRGDYRGPVEGTAQVDWLRSGRRYQVHLETSIGPVLSRHITSEGELTETGLTPRRFDGEQKVIFRAARRWQVRFGPERVVLVDGSEVPTQPGVQDEASQFVQLTWLFTTQPDKLKVGRSVEMPLVISRKLERWVYDVIGEEVLHFPFGDIPAFHLKPRRPAAPGDLTPEMWIAPSLQYLPVRILIRDNKESWIDLTLDKPPLQAGAAK